MILLVITVLTGAIIGFGTNLIAIMMLFRPWTEKRFLGMKLPFTPGMIPKRQEEIAAKLGGVVEEHLLTESGVLAALNRPEWMAEMRLRIFNAIETQLAHNQTIRELLQNSTGVTYEVLSARLQEWVHDICETRLLPGLQEFQIRDLVPADAEAWVRQQTGPLTDKLLEMAVEWADSPEMRMHLSNSIQERLMGGGVLGKMAGMFVQEDKLVDELLPYLKNWLNSPATATVLQTKLADLLQAVLDRNAGETLNGFLASDNPSEPEQKHTLFKDMAERLLSLNLYEMWANNREQVESYITKWLLRIQQAAPSWVTPILQSVGVRDIVEKEVASFPLPKLEKIVLDVVRKELALITWLGALLGGIIGLVQALLVIGWK